MHIIFNGPPGSGKDEACLFLETNYGYKHLRMKDQLFIDTARHFGVSLDWFMSDYNNRATKELPRAELLGLSKREAMIHVSESIMKPKYGQDYYGKVTASKLDQVSSYCFSDGGFVEEILPVINTVGQDNICIVQLFRTGCSFSSDSRSYINGICQEDFGIITDSYIEPQLPIRMYRILNDSSVSDFHQIIRTILGKEANVKKEYLFPRKST
jgi:hypothetical protein